MSIIPDSAKVRVKPTMTGRDPWAHVVEIARTERLRKGDRDKGHDPYNRFGYDPYNSLDSAEDIYWSCVKL